MGAPDATRLMSWSDAGEALLRSRGVWALVAIATAIGILDAAFPPPEPKPFSTTVYAEDGTLLAAYLAEDDAWRLPVRLEETSPDLIRALIEKEDARFFWHPGVDPIALARAAYQNLARGEIVSGASTITMQTARLLEPRPRTLASKAIEAIRAVQLELRYSKEEILELYLTHLPYGGNVEGVAAASLVYFKRPAAAVSLSQAVLLAVVPNDPNRLRLDRAAEETRRFRDAWLERFRERGTFPDDAIDDALGERTEYERSAPDIRAPHFSRRMALAAEGERIETLLDLDAQTKAERLVARHAARLRGKGITNAAAVVTDNRTSAVVAYVGSADFYDDEAGGEVDGAMALRSPGSALKPVAYALAFDQGWLTPKMKILDVPTNIGGYEPENYDLGYSGDVTAAAALVNSLNVPAVRVLERVGVSAFLDLLERARFEDVLARRHAFGLSAVVGGVGARLDETTRLFSAFARGGKAAPLRFRKDDPDEPETALFSPGAAYLIASILSGAQRPDFPAELLESTRLPVVSYKTGTSFGRRDAWAVGFNPRYTVGVWVGNFDAKGSPFLSGIDAAAPLLFDLFNAIDEGKGWFPRPPSVGERDVCETTGLPAGPHCERTIEDYYLKERSVAKRCDAHREVYVSVDERVSYCAACLPESGWKRKRYPMLDPELTMWYERNNRPYPKPPPHNPRCSARGGGEGPRIVSPSPDFEYLLERGGGQTIALRAASDSRASRHHWYVNGAYIGSAPPGEALFYEPKSETLTAVCMDDRGAKGKASVKVKFY